MGRERFELTITAVSRRYPNQLDYRPNNQQNHHKHLRFKQHFFQISYLISLNNHNKSFSNGFVAQLG